MDSASVSLALQATDVRISVRRVTLVKTVIKPAAAKLIITFATLPLVAFVSLDLMVRMHMVICILSDSIRSQLFHVTQ